MARDLFGRYIWLVDTIRRYGTISRSELDECWKRSPYSQGDPMPRRTFFNYRNAIEEIFKININYDPHHNHYFIEEVDDHNSDMTDWVLNSAAMTNLLSDSRDVSGLIILEDVPSARLYLGDIVTALKEHHPVIFDYHPYTRINPNEGVVVEPYFLKIFRQRWYLTGRNTADNAIKTYALDRISNLRLSTASYVYPEDFDPNEFFRDSFGIIFTHSDAKKIVLKVDPRQAKYFRALPLHHSQIEMVGDGACYFTYNMKISDDFVQEILSHGSKVTVIQPPELRAMVVNSLKESLENYSNSD